MPGPDNYRTTKEELMEWLAGVSFPYSNLRFYDRLDDCRIEMILHSRDDKLVNWINLLDNLLDENGICPEYIIDAKIDHGLHELNMYYVYRGD